MSKKEIKDYYFRGKIKGKMQSWNVQATTYNKALNRLYVVLGVERIPRLIALTEDQYKAKRHKHPEKGLVL